MIKQNKIDYDKKNKIPYDWEETKAPFDKKLKYFPLDKKNDKPYLSGPKTHQLHFINTILDVFIATFKVVTRKFSQNRERFLTDCKVRISYLANKNFYRFFSEEIIFFR